MRLVPATCCIFKVAKIYQIGLFTVYAALNTHNLDMVLQLKYMPIVMNPARIALSDWKS